MVRRRSANIGIRPQRYVRRRLKIALTKSHIALAKHSGSVLSSGPVLPGLGLVLVEIFGFGTIIELGKVLSDDRSPLCRVWVIRVHVRYLASTARGVAAIHGSF